MKKFLAGIFFLLSGLSPIEVLAASSFYDYVHNVTRYCQHYGCSSCSGIEVEKGYFHHQMLIDCHSCMPGYHLGDAVYEGEHARVFHGTCDRDTPVCPSNCSSCSDSSTCTSCYSGYTLSNGKCVNGSESESGSVSGGDSSSTCGNGYVLINGVCEEICQYQVNLEGGVCEKYCAGTVGSSSQIRRMCLYAKCFDGREPKSTKATYLGENRPHRYCCPENCADCSDWGQCTSCYSGYIVSNGECVKKPTCSNGQYTASDGTCQPCSNISVPNGSCLSCSSSSQCDNISCNTGYVKKGGTCVKAATCTYPLKEVTDYSGECVGCCTD